MIAIAVCVLVALFGLAVIVTMLADRPRRSRFEVAMRDVATYQSPRGRR